MEKFRLTYTVADFLFNRHLYHKAIDVFKEAQVLMRRRKVENCSHLEIALHYKLAVSYSSINEFKEALESYQQLLKVSKEVRDKDWEVKAYRGIIDLHCSMGQHAPSIFFLRKQLQIAKENGEKQMEIEAYTAMGYSYYNLGKPNKLIECLNDALKICREIKDKQMEGEILRKLGSAHMSLARYPEAIRCLEESLEISNRFGKYKAEGESYQCLAMIYQDMGDYDKALECNFKSLELMAEHGNEKNVGVCYNNIGTTYCTISRNYEALDYLRKSLEIMKSCGIKTTLGKAHHSLGLCYTSLGRHAEALEHQLQAVKILEETGGMFEIGRASSLLGNLYKAVGQREEAVNSFEKAIKCSQTTGDRKIEANAYRGLGDEYVCLANYCEGEKCFQRALKIAKEIGDKNMEASSYSGLGFCYTCCGRLKESLDNFNLAIPIMQQMRTENELATTLINAASAYQALRKPKKAKELRQKALKITRKIGDKEGEREALHFLGISYRNNGEVKKAHDCFSESITCAEKNRELLQDELKLSLDNQTFLSYECLCSLRISQGNFSEALCTAERGRARALGDLLSEKYGIQRKNSQEFYLNNIRDLSMKNQSTILFLAKPVGERKLYSWVLEDAEIQFRSWEFQMAEIPIDLLTSFQRGQSVSECEDRSLSAYYGLKLSPEKVKSKRRQRLFEEDEEKGEKKEDSIVKQWYKNIFAPVADLIQRRQIIIIPEGELFMVPFCALCDNNDKFLSETFQIRLSPSLTALRIIQDSPKDYHSVTGALIVGNPTVPPQTMLPPLPGARREAMEIAELLGVSATVGDEATKTQVLQRIQEVNLIHIAAHGDAERGEIALASKCPSRRKLRKDDFMLTMEDVAKW
ncbi:tetratricopeptide repeat protein 28-like [Stylophora pistillata]|uniref:tetratricopeptide repeat protein 28-like n=1 Tax=Stylophora pistillata TaxID=50429 RepID=UPI000C04AC00|nr:tetratricopeptide repeat protein 28-like [Stylophora pistillata]